MINRFDAKEAEECFGRNFIAIDPGTIGACVVFVRGQPVEVIKTSLDATMIADAMQRNGVTTMVIERQFVKMNAASALELAWRTGMMVGAVANELGGLDVVEVYPSTWQAWQRKAFKIKEKLNRAQGIRLALMAAEVLLEKIWTQQVGQPNKQLMEGIASAASIGQWWLGIQADKEADEQMAR